MSINEKAFLTTWWIVIVVLFVIAPLLTGCTPLALEKEGEILLDADKVIVDIEKTETDL